MLRASPSRLAVHWPLRLIAALSLLAPAIAFGYSAFHLQRDIRIRAEERIRNNLDILHEHALKALQTVERSISEINEVMRNNSDDDIRAQESTFSLRFKRTQQALPQMESIWAFDRDGRPLVSSTIFPVPRNLNNSDRSYFAALKDADVGTFVGEVVRARVGSLRFFVVSGRRDARQPGTFDGVIGVTVLPEHFVDFYGKLSRGDDAFALLRTNGTFLARYPEAPGLEDQTIRSSIASMLAARPNEGLTTATGFDGRERLTGYRRVTGFPVYVQSGIETAAISGLLWRTIVSQLALGIPAVLVMFGLSMYALYRANRFQEEVARREQAEAALKQSQRLEAIGQLTGGVAHDFNNLLMVVAGNAQRIKRAISADLIPPRALEAIEIAVTRGANLTRQLLAFSRQQPHEPRPVKLQERLSSIQQMLEASLRGDIDVSVKFDQHLWPAHIDVGEFDLALLNLAVNARDAMPNGGHLSISAENVLRHNDHAIDLDGEFVAVRVADSGSGIPPDVISRVFEPFFTTKEVGKGTGLGLSQVYGFARQVGGTAKIDSEIGRGTTVTLFLPRAAEPAAGAQAPEERGGVQRGKGSILMVEDNAEVAEVTRDVLEDLGYTTAHAADAHAALKLIDADWSRFDAVLSDVVMPGSLSGLDLARIIRDRHGPYLPVVLVSGYSGEAHAATEAGFLLLRKPFKRDEIGEALSEVIRQKPAAVAEAS